jgi:chromate transporter
MPPKRDSREKPSSASVSAPTFKEAVAVWLRIGLLGFGGPAGQIALMHRELVETRNWVSETRFLHALNYCMLLPGPEAQQLATYIGWLLHRTPGGIVAGTLFVLPGFLVILTLSLLYALYHEVPTVAAALFGLKAAVVAIVIEALIRVSRRALRDGRAVATAVAAFIALFFFAVPFPIVVISAAAFGFLTGGASASATGSQHAAIESDSSVVDRMFAAGELTHTTPRRGRALRVIAIGLLVWWAPVLFVAWALGGDSVFVDQALFFSKAAVVTFGGAYAVLAYVAQQASDVYGWLAPGEMLDGLGLAETTPGPLILVLQFVGFIGAYRHPGSLDPVVAGVIGSVLTVWVTFVPCFLWIFLGAPYIEALRGNRKLQGALSAITAAVVGVIANLSVWFALHTVFGTIAMTEMGPLRLLRPEWATLSFSALALTIVALIATFKLHLGMPKTLALSAALGLAVHALS